MPKSQGTSPDNKQDAKTNALDDSPPTKCSKAKLILAKNDHQVATWKITSRNFKQFHEHRDTLPKVEDKTICLKFLLLGSCNLGTKCKCFHGQLKDQKKVDFQQWFNSAKQE